MSETGKGMATLMAMLMAGGIIACLCKAAVVASVLGMLCIACFVLALAAE